jgi:hypothetical protein
VLAGALAATAFSGLAGQALAAAPQGRPAPISALADSTTRSLFRTVVLPEKTPRIDLVRGEHDYSPVGVHLGDGLVQDTNGNLVLVPSMTYGWDLEVRDFSHVGLGKGGEKSVTRFGSTVHYKESSTKRHIITEQAEGAEIRGPRGEIRIRRDLDGNLQASGPDGLKYEILKTRDGYRILPAQGTALHLRLNEGSLRLLEGGRPVGAADNQPGELRLSSAGGQAVITRSEGGHIYEIDGENGWGDARIIKDGRLVLGDKDSQRLEVDPPRVVNDTRTRYQQILEHLEAVEPGWAQKHPVVASVLEYAAANPQLLSRSDDPNGMLQAGTTLATAGGALQSGVALNAAGTALSLAESAKALGAAALSAKAAAQAAAQAGNMAQAAALAREAQELGARAREIGNKAMETGKHAKNAAQVARIMLGVAGALQIVDGGFDIHGGAKQKSLIDGAIAVTQAQMDELKTQLQGPELERAMQDYTRVMKVLQQLQKQADKEVTVGGLKIGFGALLLVSALLGPEAPMALALIGIGGTVGTAVYQHWDEIHEFLTGDPKEVPSFLDVVPDSDRVRIDLGNRKRRAGRYPGLEG